MWKAKIAGAVSIDSRYFDLYVTDDGYVWFEGEEAVSPVFPRLVPSEGIDAAWAWMDEYCWACPVAQEVPA